MQSQDVLIALAQFVSRLEGICQDEHRRTRELIVKSQRRNGPSTNMEEITAGIEMLDVSRSKESKLRTFVRTDILKSLQFPKMTSRYENVFEAYPETFEWAFGDTITAQLPWSNLAKWLKEGDGVYWISGKAGSGKSTLMKRLLDDSRTRRYLEHWAQREPPHAAPLCLATFFFWNNGTLEQKSQLGMLRTLLFQVLSQHPDLLPVVFPARWARAYSIRINGKPNLDSPSWSLRECAAAFKALLQQSSVPLKICLLIDGLDECEGDHDDLVELCMNMTKTMSQNIKACLSSRPWVVFQDSFRTCSSLKLQDLTDGDIQYYVRDRLHRNSAFQSLMERDPESGSALMKEIEEKADGVFLWVRLVVKSLLDGIRNRDAMPDLLRRLRQTPRELEPLYQHLLSLIDPIYTEWASTAFELVRVARDLEVNPFGKFIKARGVQPLTLLAFHLAMNRDINTSNVEHITESSLSAGCQDTAVHISARCCGLLEMFQPRYETFGVPEQQSLVRFFHLTVREFFEKSTCWSRHRDNNGSNFELYFALLRSHALLIGTRHASRIPRFQYPLYGGGPTNDVEGIGYSAFVYAYHADIHADNQRTKQAHRDLLEYLGKIMKCYFSFWHDAVARRIRNKHIVWGDVLSEVFNLEQATARVDPNIQLSYLRIAKVHLSSGANPRLTVVCQGIGEISVLELLTKHLTSRFPNETATLLIELNRQLDSR